MESATTTSLHNLSIGSLALAALCALAIAIDVARKPQEMAVMNIVWPLTALFGSLLWLLAYWRWGRAAKSGDTPQAISVLKASSHCGAGCTLGDILAEGAVIAFPAIAVWFGYGSLFHERMFAMWIPDFLLAYIIGIAFQYASIKPTRPMRTEDALRAALKADTLSIAAWQIGMYGGMAALQFLWMKPLFGHLAEPTQPEFWFAMQIAMLAGFATAYPANWLLIRLGIKEAM